MIDNNMNRSRYEVPPELTNLLLDFTVSVLVNKPPNLIEYAAHYFDRLNHERQNMSNRFESATGNENHFGDDDNDSTSSETKPPTKLSFTRRKSVFAEHYDPEEDEDDDNEKIIYPKSDEQRQRLGEAVRNILLFRSLDQSEMSELLDAMFEKKVEQGEVVIRQGDDGDYFYVIQKGTYKIVVVQDDGSERQVGEYTDSGSFGELALLYNMPRAATIRAMTDGSLWAMSRHTFRKIVLKRAFRKRKEYEALIEKVDMLKSLKPYEKMSLSDALLPRTYKNGDLIIKQGDEADGMYFVQEGVVRIVKINEETRQEQELSRLTKGGYFGELALITHKPRAASAYALGPEVKLAFLDVQAFERLLGPCMDIMKRNFNDYEDQLVKIFGSKANVTDLR